MIGPVDALFAPPPIVRADIVAARAGGFARVRIRDLATGRTVCAGAVREVAEWIDANGFRHVAGSAGVWRRAADRAAA